MTSKINLLGKQFGEWEVISEGNKSKNGNTKWICRCSCGTVKEVDSYTLRSGKSTKCRKCVIPHNKTEFSDSPLKNILALMKQRCLNPGNSHYKDYGARGITIYQPWLDDSLKFYKWATENGYKKGMSIDRIDNNKGYEPNNCKFIPFVHQSRNRRNTIEITIDGETKILSEWCDAYNINRDTVKSRIKSGMTYKEAFTKPVNRKTRTPK